MKFEGPHSLETAKSVGGKLKPGSEYSVDELKKIGSGLFSQVFSGNISFGDGEKVKNRTFAIKFPVSGLEQIEEPSEAKVADMVKELRLAIKKHTALKELGLKQLPTTYRLGFLDETHPVLVMTDFTQDGAMEVISNRKNEREEAGGEPVEIESLVNFSELCESLRRDAYVAAAAGCSLRQDSFFFMIPAEGGEVAVDVAIGDLEDISISKDFEPVELYEHNLSEVQRALSESLQPYFANEEKQQVFEQMVELWAEEARSKMSDNTGGF